MDAFVKVRDLRKRFGDLAAVDGVSFEVGEGHTLGVAITLGSSRGIACIAHRQR